MRLGTLQAIPIGDSILWVRPWYVQAEQTPIPQLSFVVMAYGDQVVRARTLEGAVKLAFPERQRRLHDHGRPAHASRRGGSRADAGGGSGRPTAGRRHGVRLDRLDDCAGAAGDGAGAADQANQLYTEAKAALKTDPPDFATYDAKIAKAFELVTQAEQLSGGTPPSPTDTPRLRRHGHHREHVVGPVRARFSCAVRRDCG